MRAIVDRSGLDRRAASTSQMGRFETAWLTSKAYLGAPVGLRPHCAPPRQRHQGDNRQRIHL